MTVHCISKKGPQSGKNGKTLHMFYQTLLSQEVICTGSHQNFLEMLLTCTYQVLWDFCTTWLNRAQ